MHQLGLWRPAPMLLGLGVKVSRGTYVVGGDLDLASPPPKKRYPPHGINSTIPAWSRKNLRTHISRFFLRIQGFLRIHFLGTEFKVVSENVPFRFRFQGVFSECTFRAQI